MSTLSSKCTVLACRCSCYSSYFVLFRFTELMYKLFQIHHYYELNCDGMVLCFQFLAEFSKLWFWYRLWHILLILFVRFCYFYLLKFFVASLTLTTVLFLFSLNCLDSNQMFHTFYLVFETLVSAILNTVKQ